MFQNFSNHSDIIEMQDQKIQTLYKQLQNLDEDLKSKLEKCKQNKAKLESEKAKFQEFEASSNAQLTELDKAEYDLKDDLSNVMMHVRIKTKQLDMRQMEMRNVKEAIHTLQLKIKEEREELNLKSDQISRVTATIDEKKHKQSKLTSNLMQSQLLLDPLSQSEVFANLE